MLFGISEDGVWIEWDSILKYLHVIYFSQEPLEMASGEYEYFDTSVAKSWLLFKWLLNHQYVAFSSYRIAA